MVRKDGQEVKKSVSESEQYKLERSRKWRSYSQPLPHYFESVIDVDIVSFMKCLAIEYSFGTSIAQYTSAMDGYELV